MRKFASVLMLALASTSVLADGGFNTVPEPEALSLLGVGALAFLVSRRKKK